MRFSLRRHRLTAFALCLLAPLSVAAQTNNTTSLDSRTGSTTRPASTITSINSGNAAVIPTTSSFNSDDNQGFAAGPAPSSAPSLPALSPPSMSGLQAPAGPAPAEDPFAEAVANAPASAAPVVPAPSIAPPATDDSAKKPIEATSVQGFSSQPQGSSLPISDAQIPTTNPGMDMNINPALVAANANNAAQPNDGVPYEEKLRQRTEDIQQQAHRMALEQAKKSALPLEPSEIREVLLRLKDTQQAVQTPVRPEPKEGNRIETVSTDPSEVPKTIHLYAGNVTTLNIIDVTGEPWPIVDIGFGGNFDIKPPEPGGNILRLTPLRDFAQGNLVIRLLKMTTPITFTLRTGGDTVDYRFDARIPELGPNAKQPLINKGIAGAAAGDKIVTSFLEGAPPSGADKLMISGVEASTSAYRFAGALYVRTPLALLSPAWQSSATSADGMNVYMLDNAPVLLLSDKGTLVRAHIGDAQKKAEE